MTIPDLAENHYHVALWPTWHPLDPLFMEVLPLLVENIEAEDPYDALYAFMASRKLKRVGHAAIECPGRVLLRYDDVALPVDLVIT